MKRQYDLYLGLTFQGSPVPEKFFADFLREVVALEFESFTVIRSEGYWQGQGEPSAILRIIADESLGNNDRVNCIARTYCSMFYQECVLVTSTSPLTSNLVTAAKDGTYNG